MYDLDELNDTSVTCITSGVLHYGCVKPGSVSAIKWGYPS